MSKKTHSSGKSGNDTGEQAIRNLPGFDGDIRSLIRFRDIYPEAIATAEESGLLSAVQYMPDAAFLVDNNNHILAANDSAYKLLYMEPNAQKPPQYTPFNPYPDASTFTTAVDLRDKVVSKCLRGETVENYEIVHLRSDGEKDYFLVNGTPILNEQGAVSKALIAARNITARKRAEDALREASERLRESEAQCRVMIEQKTTEILHDLRLQRASLNCIIQNMPAGVILLDSDLKILSANKAYANYFDEPIRWRPGVPIDQVLPRSDASGLTDLLRRALDLGRPVCVHNFRYDGFSKGITYWSGTAVPVRLPGKDGPMSAVVMVTVDVTEEVHAREKLAELAALAEQRTREIESERRGLQTIIESTPIPLVVFDTEMRLMKYNTAAMGLASVVTGSSEWVAEGNPIQWPSDLEAYDGEGKPLTWNNTPMQRSLRGEVCTDVVITMVSSVCAARTFSLNSAPLRNIEGMITGVVATMVDITERMRVQQQIQEVYRREHAVAEKLQRSFMPSDPPEMRSFDIAQRYRPALDEALVGGDFYDVFKVSEDQYAVVMADVSGKGLKAAVYTAMTKYMLRGYALEECAPELALARLNEALTACTPHEVFVTLIYGIIDIRTQTFVYANAGHEQPLLYHRESGIAMTLDVTGRALALTKGSSYTTHSLQMNPGDILVLYTDGITDAGRGADRLGQERVLEMLQAHAHHPSDTLADMVLSQAIDFAEGNLGDDAALLILKAI